MRIAPLLLALAVAPLAALDVLVVQSYHQGYAWNDGIDAGIAKGLAGASCETVYMDTKRKASTEEKSAAGAAALARITEAKPRVVIAADDNAQALVAAKLAGRPDVAVVFCGVNAEPSAYGYPAANVTGVLERPHTAQSIDLLRRLAPGVKRIAFLSDDTETARATFAHMQTTMPPGVEAVAFTYAATFADWQRQIVELQTKADAIGIFTYQSVRAADGAVMDPQAVMTWTREHLAKPSVAFLDWPVRDGLLCGIAESAHEHGFIAAQMAKDVLAGKAAGQIPITTAKNGTVLLNLATAERLRLEVPFEVLETVDVQVK